MKRIKEELLNHSISLPLGSKRKAKHLEEMLPNKINKLAAPKNMIQIFIRLSTKDRAKRSNEQGKLPGETIHRIHTIM